MSNRVPRKRLFIPAEPLHQRVPTRDAEGKSLTDFMMLIPKLKEQPQILQDQKLEKIDEILNRYQYLVVYADVNLKLNLLWISMRPLQGGMSQLVEEIQTHLPEALVVGHRFNPDPENRLKRTWKRLCLAVPRLLLPTR